MAPWLPIVAVATILGAGGYGFYLYGPRRDFEKKKKKKKRPGEPDPDPEDLWPDRYGVRKGVRWQAIAPSGEESGYTVKINRQVVFGKWEQIGSGWDAEEVASRIDAWILENLGK